MTGKDLELYVGESKDAYKSKFYKYFKLTPKEAKEYSQCKYSECNIHLADEKEKQLFFNACYLERSRIIEELTTLSK
jgi:hypothetical protein